MTPAYADQLYSEDRAVAVKAAIHLRLMAWNGNTRAELVLDTAELVGGDRVVSAISEARYVAATIVGKGLADALREIDSE